MASLMLQKSKVSGVHVHHAKLPDIEYTTKGLSILVPFATTYFCESRFSSIDVKKKYRNPLNPLNNLRLALSNCVRRYERIIKTAKNSLDLFLTRSKV